MDSVQQAGLRPLRLELTWRQGATVLERKSVARKATRAADGTLRYGELGEALRVYQDLAAQHPEQAHLWDRVAQIARLLQQRSGG